MDINTKEEISKLTVELGQFIAQLQALDRQRDQLAQIIMGKQAIVNYLRGLDQTNGGEPNATG